MTIFLLFSLSLSLSRSQWQDSNSECQDYKSGVLPLCSCGTTCCKIVRLACPPLTTQSNIYEQSMSLQLLCHYFQITLKIKLELFKNITCNGTAHFKNVNNCLNTNIYSYLETSGGQSSNLYLYVIHFFNTSVNQTSVAS